jgi:hypothetical protein
MRGKGKAIAQAMAFSVLYSLIFQLIPDTIFSAQLASCQKRVHNMKIMVIIWALLALLIGCGCGDTNSAPTVASQNPEQTIADTTSNPPAAEGVEAALDATFLSAAFMIANDSGVPEALEVAEWLKQHSGIGRLSPAGGLQVPVVFRNRKLPFVEVWENDPNNSPFAKEWLSGTAEGQLMLFSDKKLPTFTVIRGRERNEFDLGMLLLHEGWHGKRWFEHGEPKNQNNAAFEEMSVRELEIKIRSAIGGEPYQKIVDHEVARQLADPQFGLYWKNDTTMRIDLLPPLDRRNELEAIFGPCGNYSDAWKRNWGVWNQAVYGLIEKKFPKSDWDSAKTTVYMTVEARSKQMH